MKYFHTKNPIDFHKFNIGQIYNLSIERLDNKTALDFLRDGYFNINTTDDVCKDYELKRELMTLGAIAGVCLLPEESEEIESEVTKKEVELKPGDQYLCCKIIYPEIWNPFMDEEDLPTENLLWLLCTIT